MEPCFSDCRIHYCSPVMCAGGSSGGAFVLTMARHLMLHGVISVVMGIPVEWLDPQVSAIPPWLGSHAACRLTCGSHPSSG